MCITVDADAVAGLIGRLDEIIIGVGVIDNEKGSFNLVLLKYLEDLGGDIGRSVVES